MSNIKRIRINKQMSQAQLAEKSGVNVRVLQHYEQGSKNIDNAKLETLLNLAAALECPLHEILENDDLKEKCKNYAGC